jgi:hypothetical protein
MPMRITASGRCERTGRATRDAPRERSQRSGRASCQSEHQRAPRGTAHIVHPPVHQGLEVVEQLEQARHVGVHEEPGILQRNAVTSHLAVHADKPLGVAMP